VSSRFDIRDSVIVTHWNVLRIVRHSKLESFDPPPEIAKFIVFDTPWGTAQSDCTAVMFCEASAKTDSPFEID
jgi:hypothetical protein